MSRLASWLASPPPDAAVEIAPGRVSAASITSSFGGDVVVSGYAIEPVPANAVVASLTSQNVADRAAVATAVRAVLGRLGTRVNRVALVIPDIAAKVSLIRFDKIPERRAEDLDAFMEALEKSGDFFDVLPVQEQATEEGLLQAVVEGRYVPPPREVVAQ